MPRHRLLFPVLFLLIGTPFYFINLHSIHELNGFLAQTVRKKGLVLKVMYSSRLRQGSRYLLQMENPAPTDPTCVWATGDQPLGVGDRVTFYYDPSNPEKARVIDGKEVSRYKMDFLCSTFFLTLFVYLAWLFIEKEILEKEAVYLEC